MKEECLRRARSDSPWAGDCDIISWIGWEPAMARARKH